MGGSCIGQYGRGPCFGFSVIDRRGGFASGRLWFFVFLTWPLGRLAPPVAKRAKIGICEAAHIDYWESRIHRKFRKGLTGWQFTGHMGETMRA